jgi:hypothetical protein
MTKLIIKRTYEWNNLMRNFGVYLDDKKIGTVANGETAEYEVKSGKHKLNSKIDWCGSRTIEFEIKENETKTIELSGFKYGTLILPIMLVILLIYVVAKTEFNTDLDFLSIFGIILFCYPLYYLTFGKKEYLRITETK